MEFARAPAILWTKPLTEKVNLATFPFFWSLLKERENNNINNNGIYIALIHSVLSALQCKKGHKNIIKHKFTYNPTVHIGKYIA